MLQLRVESLRGDRVESVHPVSAVVVDAKGALLASVGDADLVTFWRSAAKPFQAMPLVADGAADRFGFDEDAIALACASHSSEPGHLALAAAMLAKAGRAEADLACGPHVPLSPEVAARVAREGRTLTPLWSNCSGKHAGMLALATHHGWPTAGYERAAHRVQERILVEVSRWTGTPQDAVGRAVDGCTAVCFALPLSAMALGYARLAASGEASAVRIREAMMRHPWNVGGTERPCTDLMAAAPGTVFAKIGAEGVYCAGLPGLGLGGGAQGRGRGHALRPDRASGGAAAGCGAHFNHSRNCIGAPGRGSPRGCGDPQYAGRGHGLSSGARIAAIRYARRWNGTYLRRGKG